LSFTAVLWTCIALLLALLILIFSLPWIIFRFLHAKAKNTKPIGQKAYWSYISATYYLNQLGRTRGEISPAIFASDKIDPEFNTNFALFMNVYLKNKYSKETLTNTQQQIIQNFYIPFYKKVKSKVSFKEHTAKFLNFYRTINFFTKPKI
jgi:hypothetical protein